MELSDIILTLVSIIATGSIGVMRSISNEIKLVQERLTSCQIDLHRDFVHRDEYSHQIDKIDKTLDQIYTILLEGQGKK